MRINKWTLGLAAVGLVSLPSVVQAEEKMNQVWTALSSTTISGYVNTAAHWDLGSDNDQNAPAYIYNSGKQDGFNLNVVKLSIGKPLDEGQWAAGYTVDLLFGPDANTFNTTSSGSTNNTSDFAIQQAYVSLRAPVGNGLDFKMGVFMPIIGYESHDAGNNPNYTRSYGITIEPNSHTGLLVSYQFSEWLSASLGIANTFGPTINEKSPPEKAESYKTYMASVALTAPENWGWLAGSTLYSGVVNGLNRNANSNATAGTPDGPAADQTSWYIGSTLMTPVEGLKVGASYDYAGVSGQNLTDPGTGEQSGYANATSLYLSYQATEKLSLHGRGELFTTDAPTTGLPSKVLALTGTLQYDLWQNVISRLEFRWDHAADDSGDAYAGSETPSDPALKNQYLVALNIIYKF